MPRSDLIIGRLKAHGRAPYRFESGAETSYYLKVQTDRGERTLWGQDLARAIEKAVTQPEIGDVIGARSTTREAITLRKPQRDSEGRVIGETRERGYRNRWVVEKAQFLYERARLARRVRDAHSDAHQTVRDHPELISTYLSLRGAQEIANRRMADPKDRERFVALVREAIAGSVEKGEPLPVVRMRETQATARNTAAPTPKAIRDQGPTR
jgi:hypothetical protein